MAIRTASVSRRRSPSESPKSEPNPVWLGRRDRLLAVIPFVSRETTRDITPAVEAEFRAHGNSEQSGQVGRFSFDGKHLRLKSQGQFENVTWDDDDDLPVFTFKARR